MTPLDLLTFCRQRYNAVNNSFWTDAEIYNYIYQAEVELAQKAKIIQQKYTTNTIELTMDYAYPQNTIEIKRIIWNGIPMKQIDFKEDDIITGNNFTTTLSGDPRYYWTWDYIISLRPTPSSVQPLIIYTYDLPTVPTAVSVLECPIKYQSFLSLFVLSCMVAKDQNIALAKYYQDLWDKKVLDIISDVQKSKRAGNFSSIKDEEALLDTTIFGLFSGV